MNVAHFWLTMLLGVLLVVIQAIASWRDGYLTQAQMRSRGVMNGWSFMEHGGMWADVFVISPIVAYLTSKYSMNFFSVSSLAVLAVVVTISFVMGSMYQRAGIVTPEAHTHDGITTLAGWIHGLFAVAAMWVCVILYLGLTTPLVSKPDLIIISSLLTPFFYLGVTKFSKDWKFTNEVKLQVAVEMIILWVFTGMLWYS